ncbi:DUF6318 family protein [Arthrobacter tumbae]|uniref:DUF6318 family protein n=1 Tax=Arthrobacter tumbae TaxID=163874 RepID=UPI00195BB8C4|nr:DUF6318 family protein [Arthrobacter tumbae]MBM7782829.1 hypothetical protein [Arthrobacter tumbae]
MNIPVPEKPALADENSVEGLEAFTTWWFELLNYAYATNDLEPLKAVTDPECGTCSNITGSIGEAFAKDGWVVGNEIQVENFDSEFEQNVHGSVSSFITITQQSATYYASDGTLLNETPGFTDPDLNELIAFYENRAWRLLDVGAVNVD